MGSVRALHKPVPIESTGPTGFRDRSFEVTFASPSSTPQEDNSWLTIPLDDNTTPQGVSQRSVAEDHPFYQVQVDAWCGLHAINNFLGGPYCTEADCHSACARVVAEMSEAGDGDRELSSQHLHPETGWLSIDVINVLGAGQLGIHVEGASITLEAFLAQGTVDAFVNCNNQHWTVLVGYSHQGPWIHTNSIFKGPRTFHGRVVTRNSADVVQILADIAEDYGSYSIHPVVKASPGGDHYLEAAGRRSILPPEEEVISDRPAPMITDHVGIDYQWRGGPQELSLVTVNVDGMGNYTLGAEERITGILQEILKVSPQFVLLQEVTMAMYVEIKRILTDWQVYRNLHC